MTPLTSEQVASYRALILSAKEHERMSQHTSFRMGGPARLYVVASSPDVLIQAVQAAERVGIPWYVFGGGSNLLVADEGFEGVMIQSVNHSFDIQGERVEIGSGIFSVLAARKTVEAGLTGFEWAISLPGTIGGAIYGNAGCFGGETQTFLESVDVFRLSDHTRITLKKEACAFGYRDSLFKHEPYIIFGGTFVLPRAPDIKVSRARLEEILRSRKNEQPIGFVSAGCVFKNVILTEQEKERFLSRVSVPPAFDHDSSLRIAAGWLIEQAGMKGERVGDVEVSQKHGNFFLSKTTACARDFALLADRVKRTVRDKFGIELHEEVQLVGF